MSSPEQGGPHGEGHTIKTPVRPLRRAVGSGVPEGARRPRAIGNKGRVGIGLGVLATLLAGEVIKPVERTRGAVEFYFDDDEKAVEKPPVAAGKGGEAVEESKAEAWLGTITDLGGKTLDELKKLAGEAGVKVDRKQLEKVVAEGKRKAEELKKKTADAVKTSETGATAAPAATPSPAEGTSNAVVEEVEKLLLTAKEKIGKNKSEACGLLFKAVKKVEAVKNPNDRLQKLEKAALTGKQNCGSDWK